MKRPSDAIARAFRMDAEAWRRHANPWSVWTRFAAIPLMILAIWSRAWIGWWAILPVLLVIVWLWLNPRIFAPVREPRGWAARGIFGERLWLEHGATFPVEHRTVLRRLVGLGLAGLALLGWGLVSLTLWPTVFGASVLVLAQLWRIDRFGLLYERYARDDDQPRGV